MPSNLSAQALRPPQRMPVRLGARALRLPTARAYLSQCPGTVGYGSHCPSLHPQYSNTPATSHFGPRYCHMHLEPLCQSSTRDAHCSQVPAWEGWVFEVGVGAEASLDWGWQVLGAVSLGMCLLKKQGALARRRLHFLFSQVSDGETGSEGTSHQQQKRAEHLGG